MKNLRFPLHFSYANTLKRSVFLAMFICLFCFRSLAQDTKMIYGQYKVGSTVLAINPDLTFLMVDYGTAVYGKVEINKKVVKLIPQTPKHPFVLYGRYNASKIKSNPIMFQGFSEVDALINIDPDNDTLRTMIKVFNDNANCVPYPTVFKKNSDTKKLYLANKRKDEVYEYQNTNGYNDFITLYLPDSNPEKINEIILKIENGQLYSGYEQLKKSQRELLTDKDIDQIIGMKNRAFSDGEFYYCNPEYNFFEQAGVDLANYQKKEHGREYYFTTGDDPDKEDLYHDTAVIYEYRRIDPIVTAEKKYTIENGSIFHFACEQ